MSPPPIFFLGKTKKNSYPRPVWRMKNSDLREHRFSPFIKLIPCAFSTIKGKIKDLELESKHKDDKVRCGGCQRAGAALPPTASFRPVVLEDCRSEKRAARTQCVHRGPLTYNLSCLRVNTVFITRSFSQLRHTATHSFKPT